MSCFPPSPPCTLALVAAGRVVWVILASPTPFLCPPICGSRIKPLILPTALLTRPHTAAISGPLHTQLVPRLRNVLLPICAHPLWFPSWVPTCRLSGPPLPRSRFLPFCDTANKCQESQWVLAEAPGWSRDRDPTPPAPAFSFILQSSCPFFKEEPHGTPHIGLTGLPFKLWRHCLGTDPHPWWWSLPHLQWPSAQDRPRGYPRTPKPSAP